MSLHHTNCPLNFYLPTIRLLHLIDLNREVSLCSRWWLTQNVVTSNNTEDKCLWDSQPQIQHFHHIPEANLGNIMEEWSDEPDCGELEQNGIFWIQ